MKKVNQFASSKHILALAAIAAGIALPPQAVMASQITHVVQQAGAVKGTVVDSKGEPIIGATIKVKGDAKNGTITDLDGNFTLNVKPGTEIEISYIGYKNQVVKAGSSPIKVMMQDDSQSLNEVVVVGFGTQKKVNLTGSVGLATSKDIESRPVGSAVQALQGVVPGLNIDTGNYGGDLNASKSISIRGTGTLDSNQSKGDPLILIDGMEGDLNAINPQDIESISVLKDAAASSIYGSRAPFGVILVTTKSGKAGRVQVNYNTNLRWNTPLNMPDMMNSHQYATFFDQAEFNGSGNHLYGDEERKKIWDYMTGASDVFVEEGSGGKWNYDHTYANIDWLNQYFKHNSFSQEHNASISGGSDKVTFYASGNYLSQGGFLRYGTDNSERFNFTGKINAKLSKYVTVGYNARWTRKNYSRPTTVTGDNFYSHVLRRARPVRAMYDPNGYLMSDINYVDALENGGRYKLSNDQLSQQVNVTITPLKNWNIYGVLSLKTDYNWTHEDAKKVYSHKVDPEQTYVAMTGVSRDYVYEYAYRSTYLNPTLYSDYSFSLADKHNFKVMGGVQIESMDTRDVDGKRYDMISDNLPRLDLTTSTDNFEIGSEYQKWRNAGFFGRINYDFDGKYLVEANLRYDGSSRFRKNSRWVWSPSFSLGWNIARENFWKPLEKYVNTLKIRASYGELANQNTTSWYPTYQTITVSSVNGKWLQNGSLPNTSEIPGLISTTLTWEKIKNTNIGLDFGAFNNRLTGSFDYFWRKSQGLVGPGVELPKTLGTSVPSTNNTDLTTSGWELTLAWRDRIGEVNYGVKLNISDERTKIDKYPNPTKSIDKNSSSNKVSGIYLGDIYGYTTIGIAKTQEEMDNHLASLPNGGQTAIGNKWEAGDIMYADINGDGKVDAGSSTIGDMGDLKKIGNTTPRFRTGITIDASWKGIDFSMFWQGVLKRDWYPGENNMLFWGATGSGQWWSTALAKHMDYFRAEGTAEDRYGANVNAYYPRPLFNNKNHQTQTKYLQNAAYMRLKNLQIGYTLPKSWVAKAGLQNVRVYVSGENLLTITSLTKLIDPELAGYGWQGGMSYPLSKTYSFGLSVNF